MASIQSTESKHSASDEPSFVFERDAELGYIVLNCHELENNHAADRWYLTFMLPILAVLLLAAAAIVLYGFAAFTTLHGC